MTRETLPNLSLLHITTVWVNKLSIWISCFCLLLLLLPQKLLSYIHLHQYVEHHKHTIGLLILIATSYLVMNLCSYFLDQFTYKIQKKRAQHKMSEKLKFLDLSERALLREFFLQRSSILIMPTEEIAVQELIESGILQYVNQRPTRSHKRKEDGIPMAEIRISMDARRLLRRSQLMLPKEEVTTKHFNKFKVIRPDFSSMIRKPEHSGSPQRKRDRRRSSND